MLVYVDITNSFDGLTEVPATAQLVPLNTNSDAEFALVDGGGNPFADVGVIPLSVLAQTLGSKMGRVGVAAHDGRAGVTQAVIAGGFSNAGSPFPLVIRSWNPADNFQSAGFPCLNKDWNLQLFSNQVGAQAMVFEILPIDDATALAAANDVAAFTPVDAVPARVASTWTAVQTSAYSAGAGQIVQYDTSGGSFVVTLPSAPLNEDTIGFVDVANSAVNALDIDGNGNDVRDPTAGTLGATTSYQIASGYLFLKFDGTDWQIVGVRD